MLIKILGTHDLWINENLEIQGTQDFSIDNDYVTLFMFGKQYTVFIRWLYNFAYYGYRSAQFIDRVTFVEQLTSRSQNHWFPRFNKPIYIDRERTIRVVPLQPRLAVDCNGNVFSVRTRKKLFVSEKTPETYHHKYQIVSFKNQFGVVSSALVHRLVASAWVKNHDPVRNILVNHIDNNGLNNHYKNLEWCTAKHNNKEATNTGCRNDNVPVLLRHKETGEIHDFASLRDLADFLNKTTISKFSLDRAIKTHFLYDGIWEAKLDMSTPWFYEQQKTLEGDNKRIDTLLEVTYPDGTKEVISGGRLLQKRFNLWNPPSSKLECLLDMMAVKHPEIKIQILFRKDSKQRVLCKDTNTGVVTEYESIREASRRTGVSRNRLRLLFTHDAPVTAEHYIFKLTSHEGWEAKEITATTKITVTHKSSGEVREFDSIRQAVPYIGISKTSIRRMLRSPSDKDEYRVETLA